MNVPRNGLPKARHLCLKRDIDVLFAKGSHSAMAYPLRAIWTVKATESPLPYQILFVAPKRKLHHAVDRNLAKRHMREAFRTNQHSLPTTEHGVLQIALLWVADTNLSYARVERALQQLLPKISQTLSQQATTP